MLKSFLAAVRLSALLLLSALLPTSFSYGYSVLTHEAIVDSLWDASIQKLLVTRFPAATPEELEDAHAYVYGGCILQDMGYYPFSSKFFSDLTHYVRSGDFIVALIRESQDLDEYAFALGALAHYAADDSGHRLATNQAVPILYPELRTRFGKTVTYWDNPISHLRTEFGFDVLQVAQGRYAADTYHKFIGFEVSKPVLERAFRDTYGLELKDLFFDEDLAIGTYRYAIAKTIPQMTRVAWKDKQDEIRKVTPQVKREAFVYSLTRRQYEQAFGTSYRRPGPLARFLVFLFKIMPKVGPLKALAFRPPTPEAERLFTDSFRTARDRYRGLLTDARDARVDLVNTDFDTGQPARWGEYPLADETYLDLLDKLASRDDAAIPPNLRRDLVRFFATAGETPPKDRDARKRLMKAREELAALRATP